MPSNRSERELERQSSNWVDEKGEASDWSLLATQREACREQCRPELESGANWRPARRLARLLGRHGPHNSTASNLANIWCVSASLLSGV